jgi:hypothetical protein
MMNERKIEILLYIGRKIAKANNKTLFNQHNIISERVLLYKDFMLSLAYVVYTKYPGRDAMSEADNKKHFNWAIKKVIKDFESEGIYFTELDNITTYIYNLFNTIFYSYEESNLRLINAYLNNILDIEVPKNDNDIVSLTILYEMLEEMLIYS